MRFEVFGEQHLAALREMLDDPDILRFTRIPVPPPPDFGETWLARYAGARRDGSREAFAVLDDDGDVVGFALVPSLDRETGEAELGYMVGPRHRGRGFATAILRQLTRWAFDQGVQRCELVIDVRNPASEKVAQRAGYVREGTMRSIAFKGGERVDAALWSRLPSDP
jgi:RimJ/RimL family protein N-acetyltransferase